MTRAGLQRGWIRRAVLLWASLWMLAVPLFHVHPEVNHRHDGTLHAHGVSVHTVLSLDADGESADHHDFDPSEEASASVSLVEHHSHSLSDHPEIGLVLLNDASERKVFKPFSTSPIAIDNSDVPNTDRYLCTLNYRIPIRASTIFVHEIRSRAPPLLFA